MKVKTILLLIFGGLVISTGSVFGYKYFSEGQIKGEQDALPTTTPVSSPTPTLILTSTPTPISAKKTIPPKPTNPPVNISVPTTIPSRPTDTPVQPPQQIDIPSQPVQPTNTPVVQPNSDYDDWKAQQPQDSRGNVCGYDSYCKYECSVTDFWVDDHLKILNNHLGEYLSHVEIFGPDDNKTKIWEDGVMEMYNMIYDECKDSPIYNPQSPL